MPEGSDLPIITVRLHHVFAQWDIILPDGKQLGTSSAGMAGTHLLAEIERLGGRAEVVYEVSAE